MTCEPYAHFQLVTDFSDVQLMNQLEKNMKMWLDWSLLKIGAWTNIKIADANDTFGVNRSDLRYVQDDKTTANDGKTWQGLRKDWVWEQGVDYGANNPQVPTITVDATPVAVGFHFDYPLGRVVFDVALATTAAVKANYSYRTVQVVVADDAPWWQELQFRSFRGDDLHFTQDERTGDWSMGGQHRIQLPCIIVESVPTGTAKGYELGSNSLIMTRQVVFHIISDDRMIRNNLVDYLAAQQSRTLWLFDSNQIIAAGTWPLDYRGAKINNNVYPDFVAAGGNRYKECFIKTCRIKELGSIHPKLHTGIVEFTTEVIFGSI